MRRVFNGKVQDTSLGGISVQDDGREGDIMYFLQSVICWSESALLSYRGMV